MFGRLFNAFKNAEGTGPDTDKPLRPRLVHPSCDFRLEAAAIIGVIELCIANIVAAVFQLIGEMAHRRKEKNETNFMLGNIGCFFLDFHHQDGVLGSAKTIKCRRTRGELITEYQNQIPGFFFVSSTHWRSSLSGLRDSFEVLVETEHFGLQFDITAGRAYFYVII